MKKIFKLKKIHNKKKSYKKIFKLRKYIYKWFNIYINIKLNKNKYKNIYIKYIKNKYISFKINNNLFKNWNKYIYNTRFSKIWNYFFFLFKKKKYIYYKWKKMIKWYHWNNKKKYIQPKIITKWIWNYILNYKNLKIVKKLKLWKNINKNNMFKQFRWIHRVDYDYIYKRLNMQGKRADYYKNIKYIKFLKIKKIYWLWLKLIKRTKLIKKVKLKKKKRKRQSRRFFLKKRKELTLLTI